MNPRYKRLFVALHHNPHQVLVSILIANSLANVTSAALSTTIMERFFAALNFSSSVGFSFGIGIGTCAILVFGEVIPKSFAKVHSDQFFASTLWITSAVFYFLGPVAAFLTRLSNVFVVLAGGKPDAVSELTSEPEIRFLIEHVNETGLMEKEKSAMLQSIFKLGLKPVREIMIPSVDVIMVSSTAHVGEALELFSKYQYSRLPVYQDHVDNIIGMVYQKDVFALISLDNTGKLIKDLIRPILFVPESMKVNQLLRKFKEQRMHIAMVTNEFGGITGLVTLEDALEEIVGDITDEYEATPRKLIALERGNGWLADGGIDLDTLGQALKIEFEVESAVTLGGFLTERLQHVPAQGERLSYKNYLFQVQQATHKRVVQVAILVAAAGVKSEKK